MIFIVVKFNVKPEWSERWLDLTREFTEATRREPGNLWFDWSRSVDNACEFVLVEAFQDDAAGAHVNSEHFAQAMQDQGPFVPLIVPGSNIATADFISGVAYNSTWTMDISALRSK